MEQLDTYNAALKECPFCGKKVNAYVNPRFPDAISSYLIASIKCDNCKIEVSKATVDSPKSTKRRSIKNYQLSNFVSLSMKTNN